LCTRVGTHAHTQIHYILTYTHKGLAPLELNEAAMSNFKIGIENTLDSDDYFDYGQAR